MINRSLKLFLKREALKIAKNEYEYHYLVSVIDYLPIIASTLSVLDKYEDIAIQRENYLSFLFHFDPRMLRLGAIIPACTIDSLERNRNRIISYFHDSYLSFSISDAIALYDSILGDGFYPSKIYCSNEKSIVNISFSNKIDKTVFVDFIDKNWGLITKNQSNNIRMNKKIISKTIVDFLIHFKVSTNTILKFTKIIFSEETGLSHKIKDSFAAEDIRIQKYFLKQELENDAFSDAYCNFLKIIESPENCEMVFNKKTLELSFNEETKKFGIKNLALI